MQASFLSLNLHTLAEQLAKATLSERLFIEPDLLPPELCTEELQKLSENEQAKDKAGVAEEVFDSLAHGNQFVRSPSNTAGTSTSSSTSTRDEILQAKGIGQTDLPRYTPEINVNTAAKKPTQFEVANAEAELDMLLGSFAETKFLEPNRVTEESWDNSFLTQNDVSSSFSERGSLSQKVPSRSDVTDPDPGLGGSVARDMKLDDIVDDLLRETSILTNKNEGSLVDETRSAFRNTPSSSNPVTKSKLTDDFDSWFDTI
nr:Large tegument protein like [Ipomoea batatas]